MKIPISIDTWRDMLKVLHSTTITKELERLGEGVNWPAVHEMSTRVILGE